MSPSDTETKKSSHKETNYQLATGGLKKKKKTFWKQNLKSHTDNKKGEKMIIVKIWQEQKEDDMCLQRLWILRKIEIWDLNGKD